MGGSTFWRRFGHQPQGGVDGGSNSSGDGGLVPPLVTPPPSATPDSIVVSFSSSLSSFEDMWWTSLGPPEPITRYHSWTPTSGVSKFTITPPFVKPIVAYASSSVNWGRWYSYVLPKGPGFYVIYDGAGNGTTVDPPIGSTVEFKMNGTSVVARVF